MKLKFAFLNLFLGCISLFITNTKFTSNVKAEDGIRDLVRSRGLGDVYKRQALLLMNLPVAVALNLLAADLRVFSLDI